MPNDFNFWEENLKKTDYPAQWQSQFNFLNLQNDLQNDLQNVENWNTSYDKSYLKDINNLIPIGEESYYKPASETLPDFNKSNFLTGLRNSGGGHDYYKFLKKQKKKGIELDNDDSEFLEGGDPKPSKTEKFMGFMGNYGDAIGNAADAAKNFASGFDKKATEGPKAEVRQAIDQGWDSASDVVSQFGPYGKAAGVAMKAVGALNSVQNAILGNHALDNMTTQDAVFSSPLGFITGLGLINALGGSRSDSITKNDEAFAQVGSSFGGSNFAVDEALKRSGKKYGAFSSGARKDANAEIAEARRQQNSIENIADTASTRNLLQSSMSSINGNARNFALQGGYQQSTVHVGRYGMRFQRASKIINNIKNKPVEEIVKFEDGGQFEYQEAPEENFVWEYQEAPDDFIIEKEEIKVEEFAKGGQFNIIPEGALHARKHNIDIDGITKKGIPVVSESEGGEIVQQAEIEHSEIILRLEVTKKLEELQKKYESDEYKKSEKDEFAIEAGKLLVEEILNNTEDRVQMLVK